MFSLLESWWKKCGNTGSSISDRSKEKEWVSPHCRFLHLSQILFPFQTATGLTRQCLRFEWREGLCETVPQSQKATLMTSKFVRPFPKLAIERYWKNILKKGWQHQLNIKHDYDFTAFATHYSWVPEVVVWWRRRSTWFGGKKTARSSLWSEFCVWCAFSASRACCNEPKLCGNFQSWWAWWLRA